MIYLSSLRTIITTTKINDLFDDNFTILTTFNNDTATTDKIKQYLNNKLYSTFKPYLDLELLYSEQTCTEILEMVFNNHFVDMYKSGVFETLFFNKNFYDFDNLGQNTSSSSTTTSYAGYDIDNQEGEFVSNSFNGKNAGQDRLKYMIMLDTATKKWCYDILFEITNRVCRLLY